LEKYRMSRSSQLRFLAFTTVVGLLQVGVAQAFYQADAQTAVELASDKHSDAKAAVKKVKDQLTQLKGKEHREALAVARAEGVQNERKTPAAVAAEKEFQLLTKNKAKAEADFKDAAVKAFGKPANDPLAKKALKLKNDLAGLLTKLAAAKTASASLRQANQMLETAQKAHKKVIDDIKSGETKLKNDIGKLEKAKKALNELITKKKTAKKKTSNPGIAAAPAVSSIKDKVVRLIEEKDPNGKFTLNSVAGGDQESYSTAIKIAKVFEDAAKNTSNINDLLKATKTKPITDGLPKTARAAWERFMDGLRDKSTQILSPLKKNSAPFKDWQAAWIQVAEGLRQHAKNEGELQKRVAVATARYIYNQGVTSSGSESEPRKKRRRGGIFTNLVELLIGSP
jgi:hypothetical protein